MHTRMVGIAIIMAALIGPGLVVATAQSELHPLPDSCRFMVGYLLEHDRLLAQYPLRAGKPLDPLQENIRYFSLNVHSDLDFCLRNGEFTSETVQTLNWNYGKGMEFLIEYRARREAEGR